MCVCAIVFQVKKVGMNPGLRHVKKKVRGASVGVTFMPLRVWHAFATCAGPVGSGLGVVSHVGARGPISAREAASNAALGPDLLLEFFG